MKKLVLLLAVLSLFAVACKSDTVIDTGAAAAADTDAGDAQASTADSDSADTSGQGDNADAVDDEADAERGSGVEATDPTPVPAATTAPAADAAPEPTQAPAEEPTSAPVEPAPGAVEAIQAVVDADDWCQAAQAVEDGTGALETLNFSDPVELEQGITQSLGVINASKRLVPDEIADDLDQSIVAFTALATALEDVNWSFLDLDLSIIESFDAPMELATYNIEAYNFTNCGIGTDPGEPPVILDDGTLEDSDLPEFDGTIRDQAVDGLVEAGFTAEEANCILEDLDFTDPAVMNDPAQLLAVFTDCGISLDRLSQLGG